MKQLSKYDIITVAYRSRMLFRSDAEYRAALGVSFETVANNRDSKRDTSIYYDILNRECETSVERSLETLVGDYVEASELYRTIEWGERTQMASRKRFCRMLFRLYATAGMELTVDEILKFKIRDDDKRLVDIFFPDGAGRKPAVEIAFILLFAFGVIKPWSGGNNSRGHDIRDKETMDSLVRLRSLIELLRDDMPRLGSTAKPMAFHEWLDAIDAYLGNPDSLSEITPLRLLSSIFDVGDACRTLADTEQRRIYSEQMQGYDMPGIWIDDADRGATRFWIFPDNFLAAFCYSRSEGGWTMTPYELRIRFSTDSSCNDTFLMIDPAGNLDYTLSPDNAIEPEQLASGFCDYEFDASTDEMNRVELYEGPCGLPGWMDWRTWERIGRNDDLYDEFRAVIREVYNPESPHSLFFKSLASELSDVVNNLVGRDGKYLYVYDWRPERFMLRERTCDRFVYESESCADNLHAALFELPVSEEHPLYLLPRRRRKERYSSADAALLADLLEDSDNITELCIVHSALVSHPRLVFPGYGRSVALDMEALAEYGVRKLTKKPF